MNVKAKTTTAIVKVNVKSGSLYILNSGSLPSSGTNKLQAYKLPRAMFIDIPPTTRHQRFNPVLPVSTELTPAVAKAISISPFLPSKKLLPRFPESNNCCIERLRGNCAGMRRLSRGSISHHQPDLLRTCMLRNHICLVWAGSGRVTKPSAGGDLG